MRTREDFEVAKLELEVKNLARPHTQTPTFWISVVSALVAVVGVVGQSFLSRIDAAQAKLDKTQAEQLRDNAKKELAVLQVNRDATRTQIVALTSQRDIVTRERDSIAQQKATLATQLAALNEDIATIKLEKENQEKQTTRLVAAANATSPQSSTELRTAAKVASNSFYSISIYFYKTSDDVAKSTMNALQSSGYSIIKSETLANRTPWLAATSTVFYYDDASKEAARIIAKQLEPLLGSPPAIMKGAGDGIPKGGKRTNLRVHIVAK